MIDGIHHQKILTAASNDQLLALAPIKLRPMLSAICHGTDKFDQSDKRKILEECVDFSEAVNDYSSLEALVKIISEKLSEAFPGAIEKLAQDVGVPGAQGDKLAKTLRDQKKKVLEFLKFNQNTDISPRRDASQKIEPDFGLRYYQLMSVRNIYAQLNKSGQVMFHAPTGTGKTRMAMSVVSRHLREFGPTIVLWVASGHELVSQAENAFKEAWKYHGDIHCQLRRWHGNNAHFVPQDAPDGNIMLIASLQKLTAADKDTLECLRERVELIVFDEAHQAVAPKYRSLIEKIIVKDKTRLLGLSGTPGRADKSETTELVSFFNCKKTEIWSPEGQSSIHYLIEKGYLARAKFIKIDLDCIFPNNAEANTAEDRMDEFNTETLDQIGQSMERNIKIVEICKDAISTHSRVLAFTPSVAASHLCAAMLKATSDIDENCCVSIDANTPLGKRDRIIEDYRDVEKHPKFVIFNYNVMTTGVDVPSTSALIIGRPTKSVAQYAQMVGRAIRGEESGGNKEAYIYTVVDSALPAFRSVADAFSNWNDYWKGKS